MGTTTSSTTRCFFFSFLSTAAQRRQQEELSAEHDATVAIISDDGTHHLNAAPPALLWPAVVVVEASTTTAAAATRAARDACSSPSICCLRHPPLAFLAVRSICANLVPPLSARSPRWRAASATAACTSCARLPTHLLPASGPNGPNGPRVGLPGRDHLKREPRQPDGVCAKEEGREIHEPGDDRPDSVSDVLHGILVCKAREETAGDRDADMKWWGIVRASWLAKARVVNCRQEDR